MSRRPLGRPPTDNHLSLVSNPHRAHPDQLSVGLFAAHVVVAGLALDRSIVLPNKIHLFGIGLNRIHIPDRNQGIERLRITAEKGNYLKPYARLLLAVAALRAQNPVGRRDGVGKDMPPMKRRVAIADNHSPDRGRRCSRW